MAVGLLSYATLQAQDLTLRGSLSLSPCTAVAASGDKAYVAYSGTFRVVNLADPNRLVLLGQAATGAGTISAMQAVGSLVFGAGQADGLVIMNVANSSAPALVTRYTASSTVRDIAVRDTLVALATPTHVILLGVRNPAHPNILASLGRASSWVEFESTGLRLHLGSSAGAFSVDIQVNTAGRDTTFTLAFRNEYGTGTYSPVALSGAYLDAVSAGTLVVLYAENYRFAGQRQWMIPVRALCAANGISFVALPSTIEYLDQRAAQPQFVASAACISPPNALALAQTTTHNLVVAAHNSGISVYEYDALSATPEQISPAIPSELAVTAFPNPFNSVVSLELSAVRPGLYTLSVCDVLGRECRRETLTISGKTTRKMDFSDLTAGVYIAHLSGHIGTATAKLLYLP